MIKLLWLITVALGHRMLLEQSFHLGYRKMIWIHRVLKLVTVGWVIALITTAIWWRNTYQ